MMNIVGLCLVVTSLVTAGVWPPNESKTFHEGSLDNRDMIVKEGHRVVVVEYDQQDQPITKVSISPDTDLYARRSFNSEVPATKDSLDEKLKEDADVVQSEDLWAPREDEGERREDQRRRRGPKELICDAYGKCKHRIADAIGRTKETVSEAAEKTKDAKDRVEEAVSGLVHEAAEKAKDATHRVEEAVSGTAHEAAEKAKDAKHHMEEAVSGTVHKAAEKVKDTAHHVEEAVSGTAREAAEKAKDTKHRVSEVAHEAVDKTKETERRVEEAVSGAAHEAAEKTKQTAHRVEEAAEGAYERTKDRLWQKTRKAEQKKKEVALEQAAGEQVRYSADKAREAAKIVRDLGKTISVDVAKNVTGWLAGAGNEMAAKLGLSVKKLNPVSGAVYVLGFSAAYGTGVWVTFVLSHVLALALPRQQLGMVMSKVYPAYFRTMAAAIGTALFGYVVSQGKRISNNCEELWHAFNLLASLVLVLVNMLYLEPRATKVMFEKMKVEKEEGRGEETTEQQPMSEAPQSTGGEEAEAAPPEQEAAATRNRVNSLDRRLKKLNTLSSFLNILSLMALSWHVYYLGNRPHLTYKY